MTMLTKDRHVTALPLTSKGFAPFGQVLELGETPTMMINQGLCGRYHDLARLDMQPSEDGLAGHAGISLFDAQPRNLPYQLDMMERHPLGSQAFIPMSQNGFLVIVAEDECNQPGRPQAFLTQPGQGINLNRNIWHGVLTPLAAPGLFAVIDRIGADANLEEYWFGTPYLVLPVKGER